MAQVTFKRTATKGLVANVWIYDAAGGQILLQIPFVNDKATISLQPGDYLLHWALSGFPGDELKIDWDTGAGTFSPLLASSKIPRNPHATSTGTRLTLLRNMPFRL